MVTFLNQTVSEMGTDESSPSCNQNIHALTSAALDFLTPIFDEERKSFLLAETHSQSRRVPVLTSTCGCHFMCENAFRISLT
jgi:hypothetical protein